MPITRADIRSLIEKVDGAYEQAVETGLRLTREERQEFGRYFYNVLHYLEHASEALEDIEKMIGGGHLR